MRKQLTCFVLQEVWSNNFVIHDDTSIVLDWSHTPDEESTLQKPVEGDYLCDVERKELDCRKCSENHPKFKIEN